MKTIEYQISVVGKDTTVNKRDVTGFPVGKYLAVRENCDIFRETYYTIDHIKSGFALAFCITKKNAITAARAYRDCGIDWENIDPLNMTQHQKDFGRIVNTDLAMDGIIWTNEETLSDRVEALKQTGWKHKCYQRKHEASE